MSWAAFAVSCLALVVSGLSAWYARRATRVQEDRRRDELAPRITVEPALVEDQYVLRFVNEGPQDYAAVQVEVVTSAEERLPIDGLLVEEDWVLGGPIGAMRKGEPRVLRYKHERREGGGDLRLVLTCTNDKGTWEILRQVRIPGIPKLWTF